MDVTIKRQVNKENRNYFVYGHVRKDDGTLFYIGRGTSPIYYKTTKQKYSRAYKKNKKNKYWKKIVEEHGRNVVIIFQTNSLEESIKKERLLIEKFGTIGQDSGKLCNVKIGDSYPDFLKVKHSESAHKIPVYKYTLKGEFVKYYKSITEAWRESTCYSVTDIWKAVDGKMLRSNGGFIYRTEQMSPKEVVEKTFNAIKQYNKSGELIGVFKDSKHAAKELNLCSSAIRNCICGISKTCGGYVWSH